MDYIYFLFIIEILLFLFSYTTSDKDVLSPSCTMCIMFMLSTVFAILNIEKWDIMLSFASLSILSSGILVFCISNCVFKRCFLKDDIGESLLSKECYSVNPISDQPQICLLLLFLVFNLLVSAWYYLAVNRFVGNSGLSLGSLAAQYREIRTAELAKGVSADAEGALLNQLLKIVKASGYVAAFFLVKPISDGNRMSFFRKMILILIVASSLFQLVLVASRSGFIMFFCFVLIVAYIMWNQKYKWENDLSRNIVGIGLLGIVIGIPAFYYSASLIGRSSNIGIWDYVSLYIGAPIQLFDEYVSAPVARLSFGEESLVGISKLLSFLGFGMMSKSYNLEGRILGQYDSNVYTFFRRPLHDFGLIGMYIFTILVALLFHIFTMERLLKKKKMLILTDGFWCMDIYTIG